MTRGRRYSFEAQMLTIREIHERYMPAYSRAFLESALRAGCATRAEMLARDASTQARMRAGGKRGRASTNNPLAFGRRA